jgi:diguanylate cyclase (GGDEF)-like protein
MESGPDNVRAPRMTQPSNVNASDAVLLETRRSLLESLFADSGTMVMGAMLTGIVGLLITAMTRSPAPAAVTVLIFCVVAVRLRLMRAYRRSRRSSGDFADVQWLERANVIGASAYLLSVGLLAFTAFAVSDDPFLLTLTASGALIHTLSTAIRNFAIRTGVGVQISAVAIPLAAAFIFKGGMFPLLIPLLLAPLSFFAYGSATRLRNILLSEIAFRNRSERIASQFDFALNNMSHGMCMISADGRVLVSNNKFSEFLGLPPQRSIANFRFLSLLRLVARHGNIPCEAVDRLRQALHSRSSKAAPCAMEFETLDDRAFELTLTANSTGGWVMVLQDVTAKRNADRVIDHMAHFDSVTGLRNRCSFELALVEALLLAGPSDGRIDVLFLDLDDFKQVNDSLGHAMGDKLLIEIARRLNAIIGSRDLVARWGGDEFVILHYNDPASPNTGALARRIVDEVGRAVDIDGVEVIVGASIGTASAPRDGMTPEALLSNADIALYAAKADGRRRWRAFEKAMDTKIQVRRLVELELRAAVANDAIEVHFQPIFDVGTRRIASFEALARWRHPMRGWVSPTEFVPILEDIGLMEEFGAGVLRRACAACAAWPESVSVSVNLSSSQFRSGRIQGVVAHALSQSGLAANRLELEITESTLLDDRCDTRGALASLRGRGCRISLDDFGTGYSSLSYLLSFPLDRIKIDRSFTIGLGVHERASILVESVAAMSRKLGMTVLIEGVESERQMSVIEQLGTIDEAQGYLFSSPVPLPGVAALFDRERGQAAA